MIAYKGFTKDLTARLGSGDYQYEAGGAYETPASKTARYGFHCAENPLDCFAYYPPGNGNRYFMVEASGSIDETDWRSDISCTKIRLIRELSVVEMVYHAMRYMIEHPDREWNRDCVFKEKAEAAENNPIVVVRGVQPKVKGKSGSILGLLLEKDRTIIAAKLLVVGKNGIKPDQWYEINEKNGMEETA